jgi:ribosomal protein S18 acetylase RimI-like enzyme
MGELRPEAPTRRPDTARPRGDGEPAIEPPSVEELERIQRHLCSLAGEAGAEVRAEPALGALIVRRPGGGPEVNHVAMPRWSTEGWREALARACAALAADGAWPSLLVADRLDRPIGLAGALAAAGWRAVRAESVLWVGRAAVVPHLDPALRIEAVQPRGVTEHERLEREVFGLPEGLAEGRRAAIADAIGSGRVRAFIVRLHGEAVAVARLSQGDGVAGLYGIGVAEAHRGRGLGTLVTTVATRAGLALGNRLVWLSVEEGNERAARVYARLGFVRAFGWSRWLGPEPVREG